MWDVDMVQMLRYLIGDVESPQSYTDDRLKIQVLVGAKFVVPAFNFSQIFRVNLTTQTLSPDPTIDPTTDDWFTNLTVYKAAIILLQNELRTSSFQSVSFKEFNTSVDLRDVAKNKKVLLDALTAEFEHAELEYRMGVRISGAAILTPFGILNSMRGESRGRYC